MAQNINIKEEKLKVIDIIIDMYPELKKNKDEIIKTVLNKDIKRYILTKYIHNNNIYYIDPYGMIIDKDINFKGIFCDNKFYFENIENDTTDDDLLAWGFEGLHTIRQKLQKISKSPEIILGEKFYNRFVERSEEHTSELQ